MHPLAEGFCPDSMCRLHVAALEVDASLASPAVEPPLLPIFVFSYLHQHLHHFVMRTVSYKTILINYVCIVIVAIVTIVICINIVNTFIIISITVTIIVI